MAQKRKAAQKVRLAPRRVTAKVAEDAGPECVEASGSNAPAQGPGLPAPGSDPSAKFPPGDWTGIFTRAPRDPLKEQGLAERVRQLEAESDRAGRGNTAETSYIYSQIRSVEERAYDQRKALLARIEALELTVHGKIQEGGS